MKIKVFVLTQVGRAANTETPTFVCVGVFSTKTKAKEVMAKKKEEVLNSYKEKYNEDDYEIYINDPTYCWGIECYDTPVYDEFLIAEKIVDEDED